MRFLFLLPLSWPAIFALFCVVAAIRKTFGLALLLARRTFPRRSAFAAGSAFRFGSCPLLALGGGTTAGSRAATFRRTALLGAASFPRSASLPRPAALTGPRAFSRPTALAGPRALSRAATFSWATARFAAFGRGTLPTSCEVIWAFLTSN